MGLWLTVRTKAGPGQEAGRGAGRWGAGAGGTLRQQQGKAVTSAGGASQAGSMAGMGDPTYTTYLPTYPYQGGHWQWQHGRVAWEGWPARHEAGRRRLVGLGAGRARSSDEVVPPAGGAA